MLWMDFCCKVEEEVLEQNKVEETKKVSQRSVVSRRSGRPKRRRKGSDPGSVERIAGLGSFLGS